MFYVLVYICAVTLTGTDCVPIQEPRVPGYVVMEECEQKARQMIDLVKATDKDDPRIQLWPNRPWNIKGFCISPVIDETYVGWAVPAQPHWG